jgi:hypothetical protein
MRAMEHMLADAASNAEVQLPEALHRPDAAPAEIRHVKEHWRNRGC